MDREYYGKKRPRIPELDMMKTIAVVSMVFVHVLEVSSALDTSAPAAHGIAAVIEFFGCVPSAGVFMFIMGWGAALSRKAGWKTYLDRFLQLSLLGVVVNFFQQLVPMLLAPETFGRAEDNLHTLIAVDIYPFAALATLYFALMQKLNRTSKPAAAFTVVLVTVCMGLNAALGYETFTTGNDWLDTLLGLVIRENEYSYFPFISWIIFPAAGYFAAFLYQKPAGDKGRRLYCLGTGIGLILVSELLMEAFSVRDVIIRHVYPAEEAYYAMHPVCGIGALGMILTEFALASFIPGRVKERLSPFFVFVSRNVMFIYVAQWILIGSMSPVLANVTRIGIDLLFSLGILTTVCLLARGFKRVRAKLPERVKHPLKYLIR